MEKPLIKTWPGVCILWAMVSSSAYANVAQDVTTDACDALAPCIVQLNAVASDRVVRCENGVVSYEITQEFKVSGYKLGQFRLPEEMPLIPGLESLISGSHAWYADGLRKYSEYQKFAYSVVAIASDMEEWGNALRACLDDALSEGYTVTAVHSEFTATGRGQSDAQDFNPRSEGNGTLKLAQKDWAALTEEQKEEYRAVAQSGEYASAQILHVQLGLLRIFFADNWAYDHMKDKVGQLWSKVFPRATVIPTKRNPPHYQRLMRAATSGDAERFAALRVTVSLRVAIQLPSPLSKSPAPPSPRPSIPEESEKEEDCVKCWEFWLRWTCLTCERGLKRNFWPPCCRPPYIQPPYAWPPWRIPVGFTWPPSCWCILGGEDAPLAHGPGMLVMSGTVPLLYTYEAELPLDLCVFFLRLRVGLFGTVGVSLPPVTALGAGGGVRTRFWIPINDTTDLGVGGEGRLMGIPYHSLGEGSDVTGGWFVGLTVAIEPLVGIWNLEWSAGMWGNPNDGGLYTGLTFYRGSRKPPRHEGENR